MTVTLLIGQKETKVNNSQLKTSETIVNLLSDLQLDSVEVEVPPQYSTVVNIYLGFTSKISCHDKEEDLCSNNSTTINDVKTLLLCFRMEAFFADNVFFVYLMKQTYSIWDEFRQYIPSLPDERLVYLYTAFEFVPGEYMSKGGFFKEWLNLNANKNITLCRQGDEVHHTEVTYYNSGQIKELKAYHTIDGKEVGYAFRRGWYTNSSLPSLPSLEGGEGGRGGGRGQLQYRRNYKDDEPDGLWEGWYANGQLQYRRNYKDGQRDGLWEYWYLNSSLPSSPSLPSLAGREGEEGGEGGEERQLQYRSNYKSGRQHGLQEGWYASPSFPSLHARKGGEGGQLQYRYNYKDGEQDGLQEAWFADGRPWYRYNYRTSYCIIM